VLFCILVSSFPQPVEGIDADKYLEKTTIIIIAPEADLNESGSIKLIKRSDAKIPALLHGTESNMKRDRIVPVSHPRGIK
jgi:hypothetical protein